MDTRKVTPLEALREILKQSRKIPSKAGGVILSERGKWEWVPPPQWLMHPSDWRDLTQPKDEDKHLMASEMMGVPISLSNHLPRGTACIYYEGQFFFVRLSEMERREFLKLLQGGQVSAA